MPSGSLTSAITLVRPRQCSQVSRSMANVRRSSSTKGRYALAHEVPNDAHTHRLQHIGHVRGEPRKPDEDGSVVGGGPVPAIEEQGVEVRVELEV